MSEAIEKLIPVEAIELLSDWQCQHCGRDMNGGPLIDNTDLPIPDNRIGAVVVDVADDLQGFLVVCRWCARDDDVRRRFEIDD